MENLGRQSEIRKKLFQNSALMGISRILLMIASLVCVPFIVKYLGWEAYGVWETIFALSGLTTIILGPLSSTILWRVANTAESHGMEYTFRLMRIGIFVSLVASACMVPLAWMFREGIVQTLNIPPDHLAIASWLAPTLIAITLLSGVNESMAALLIGYQKAGFVSVIQMVAMLLQYGAIILGLCLGFGFLSLLAGLLASSFLQGIGFYWEIRRLGGKPSLLPAIPQRQDFQAMGGYAGLVSIGYLSALLREQTDKLVLAGVGASMTLVASYGIASRLANLLIQFYNFFGNPMISAVGALYGAGDWSGVKRVYSNMNRIVLFTAGALVVLLMGFYDRLLVIWMGKNISAENSREIWPLLALLLLSNFVLILLTGPGSALCRGIGKVGIETRYVLVNLVLKVVLTVVLVLTIGAMGTVVSSAVSWALSAIFFAWIFHRSIDIGRSDLRMAVWSMVIVTLSFLLARVVSQSLPSSASRFPAAAYAILAGLPVMLFYFLSMVACGIVPFQTLWALRTGLRRKENG